MNRSWVRFCACEFYLNGVRIGATAGSEAARPSFGREVQVISLPVDTPPGKGVLAVRRYQTPAQLATSGRALSGVQLVGISRLQATMDAAYNFRFMREVAAIMILLLVAVLVTLAGKRFERLSLLHCVYLLDAAAISFLYRAGATGDYSHLASWALALSVFQAPLVVSVLAILARCPAAAALGCTAARIPFHLAGGFSVWGLQSRSTSGARTAGGP